MDNEVRNASILRKVRYNSSVTALYAMTLLFALTAFGLVPLPWQKRVSAIVPLVVSDARQVKPITAGKPVKIIIPGLGIDLPVDEGFYNASNASWTLSGYHAQFAMLSYYANDTQGNTFIYGHNNKFVFGPIKNISPNSDAMVYTDNGHVFSYIFEQTYAVTPDNTSVFTYQGPSILTIQTCSGNWNEQRQMYTFKFKKVIS
jgi:LPXTG-site transpeptidase (sortase) family protein